MRPGKSEVSSRPYLLMPFAFPSCNLLHAAGSHPDDSLLDASVGLLCHLVKGQSMLDSLDGPRHGRGHPLDASLDGRLEEGDVALPARSPLECLTGETLLGTGEHEVEWGKGANTSSTEAEDFTPGGGGNAERHDGDVRSFVGNVVVFWMLETPSQSRTKWIFSWQVRVRDMLLQTEGMNHTYS